MDTNLDDALAKTLIALVHLDAGQYEEFSPWVGAEGDAEILGISDPDDVGTSYPPGHLNELASRGFLDMQITDRKVGKFRISPAGRALAQQLASRDATDPVDLSWETQFGLLKEIYEAWKEAGAPGIGFPLLEGSIGSISGWSESQSSASFRELRRQGFLEGLWPGNSPLPSHVRPGDRALPLLDGWPSSEARVATEQIIEGIGTELERSDDAQRGKKQAAFHEIKDVIRDVGVDVLGAALASQAGLK